MKVDSETIATEISRRLKDVFVTTQTLTPFPLRVGISDSGAMMSFECKVGAKRGDEMRSIPFARRQASKPLEASL